MKLLRARNSRLLRQKYLVPDPYLEAAMRASGWIRQFHRWTSIVFTVTVIANFIDLARGGGNPPTWITYSPLLPLALLLFTGLYLFVLPYLLRRRGGGPDRG